MGGGRGRPRSVRSPRIARLGGRGRRGRASRRRPAAAVAVAPDPAAGVSAVDVSPEMRGVPAAGRTVERMGARPDRLVRPALPVGEVVAALVARPRPVADLVAAPAVGRRDGGRRGGTAPRRDPRPARRSPASRQRRAPRRVGRWSPSGPVRPSAVGVVERQGIQREVVRLEVERGFERVDPRVERAARDVVEQVEVDRGDAALAGAVDRVPDVGRRDGAGRGGGARAGPGSGRRTRSG